MASSRKKSRPIATFKYPAKVEVYRPAFKAFASLKQLDAAKLARAARAEIEVGVLKTDCCQPVVRAIVRKGKVTGLRVESEGKMEGAAPELARLLNNVRRRVPGGGRPPRFPMPVATFLSRAGLISTETITCYAICIYGHCLMCCYIESAQRWICTLKGIVVKPDPTKT
jgi:hypothetical protein